MCALLVKLATVDPRVSRVHVPIGLISSEPSTLTSLTPPEFFKHVVEHVPVDERRLAVAIVGAVNEGPDRAWVLVRLELAARVSSGIVISTDEFTVIGKEVAHDPWPPTLVDMRREASRWVVGTLDASRMPLPGTGGFAF